MDTIHILFDNDNACVHGDTIGVDNISLSCGGTETSQHTEVIGSIVQRFVEINTRMEE